MLPDGWTERPATTADLADVARLVIANDIAEIGMPDWSEQDQADEWADPRLDLSADTLVVHDDTARLVGYAYVVPRVRGVDFDSDTLVDPGCAVPGVEEHLMAFTERRARAQVDPSSSNAQLVTVAYAANVVRRERFGHAGFAPVRHFYRMTIALDPAPVDVVSPPGVEIQPCGADQAPDMHAVLTEAFRDHYRSVPQSFEEWSARHPRADVDSAPWLLAHVDGALAGGLTSNVSVPGTGWIQAVGVLPSARGRGVGLALLSRAFADLAVAGNGSASLGVDAENATGALRLYEKAGMHVERRIDFFAKRLSD